MPLPERKLHRLKSWDYAQAGYYFVTVCTQNKKPILSHLHQQGMDVVAVPSKIGQVVINCWQEMNSVSPYVRTDAFCLMPNHIHGIIIIEKPDGAICPSVSQLVRGFKSAATRQYNAFTSPEHKNNLWQSSFYDEIIRNEEMLYDIRRYILGNPSKWLDDPLFTK